jgi:hypothetical protein
MVHERKVNRGLRHTHLEVYMMMGLRMMGRLFFKPLIQPTGPKLEQVFYPVVSFGFLSDGFNFLPESTNYTQGISSFVYACVMSPSQIAEPPSPGSGSIRFMRHSFHSFSTHCHVATD